MCGIVGYNSNRQLNPNTISHMMGEVAHRGPDSGAWVQTISGTYLGHQRLHVRGSDGITQPFRGPYISADATWLEWAWFAVNGEFYNNDTSWKNTDSELAAAVQPKDLIGEFAYAICLETDKRTVLVRDRFGIKPMFYYWTPGMYCFASEMKAMESLIDLESTDFHTCCQFVNMVPPEFTPFKDVYSVPPGCMVTLHPDRPPMVTRYWDLPIEQEWRDADYCTNRIGYELMVAVTRRQQNWVKPLIYTSNGMDGRLLAHLARNCDTITCDFGDGDAYADADYTLDDFPDILPHICQHVERPVYNKLAVAKWCMAQFAREQGYTTIMSGQGADELFAGYQFFNSKPWAGLSSAEHAKHPAWEEAFGFTPQFLHPWLRLWDASVWADNGPDPFEITCNRFADLPVLQKKDRLTIEQYIWIKTHFENQILWWGGDRPEMAHGIEGRTPYLDLVDIAFQIRPEDRADKKLLRAAFKSQPYVNTPKRSFMYPYGIESCRPLGSADLGTVNQRSPKTSISYSPYLRHAVRGALADVAHNQSIGTRAVCT